MVNASRLPAGLVSPCEIVSIAVATGRWFTTLRPPPSALHPPPSAHCPLAAENTLSTLNAVSTTCAGCAKVLGAWAWAGMGGVGWYLYRVFGPFPRPTAFNVSPRLRGPPSLPSPLSLQSRARAKIEGLRLPAPTHPKRVIFQRKANKTRPETGSA